jgi:hypothetical protein
MRNLWRLWLVIGVLVLGMLAVSACDDGGDGGEDEDTPTAEETTEDGGNGDEDTPTEEATEEDGDSGSSGDGALGDLPEPDDAEETASGSWSGTIPFVDPSGSVDAESYGKLDYKTYDTAMSAEDVIQYYEDGLGDWNKVYAFSGGASGEQGAFGIWSQNDNDNVVWIGASEAGGTTSVTVILGSKE